MASSRAYKDAPVSETCPDVDKMIALLEELRSANAALRQWGAEQFDRADQAEEKLSEALDTIKDLQDEVGDLTAELREANNRIEA